MTISRRRQIVRSAVLVLAAAGIFMTLIWMRVVSRQPPEIDRSRAVQLGMWASEVNAIMGFPSDLEEPEHGRVVLLYDASRQKRREMQRLVADWTHNVIPIVNTDVWPVRIRIDDEGRVDRIERGFEVEESPRRDQPGSPPTCELPQ